jgi:hypothetical protein
MSMTRLGRNPQMLYAYYRTQQAEMAGMIPKVPVTGYEGQFRGHESEWQKANHEPVAFLQFKGKTEETGNQTVLPPPTRMAYTGGEQIQALEICAEGARRAIQAAMGTSPLPTQAQRRNEKSGVALKQMDESFQAGSFHFVDHYEQAITRGGVILEDWTPHYYDAARDVTVREPNDNTSIVRINDPNADTFPKTQKAPLMVGAELHDVTLSTGPSNDSEREVANDLSDSLVQNIPMVIQVAGQQAGAKILASSIRLKNVGPLGDEMAEIISPKDDNQALPPKVQQQMQQAQKMIDELTAHVNKLTQDQEAKTLELKSKQQIAMGDAARDIQIQQAKNVLELEIAKLKAQTELAKAEIAADTADKDRKIAALETMIGVEQEARLERHTALKEHGARIIDHTIDLEKQAREHLHEQRMADADHDRAKELVEMHPEPTEAGQ